MAKQWWNAVVRTDLKDSPSTDADQIDDLASQIESVSGTVTSEKGHVSARISLQAQDKKDAELKATAAMINALKRANIKADVASVKVQTEEAFNEEFGFSSRS